MKKVTKTIQKKVTRMDGSSLTFEDRYMKISEVSKQTALANSSLYRQMDIFKFPPSHKLSESRVGWLEADVLEWMQLGGSDGFYAVYGEQLKEQKELLAA
jgi:predicted DNA-binding transcriptional regulator AlpA